jgi:hypothetical protein
VSVIPAFQEDAAGEEEFEDSLDYRVRPSHFFFFVAVLGFKLRAYTWSHSISPFL